MQMIVDRDRDKPLTLNFNTTEVLNISTINLIHEFSLLPRTLKVVLSDEASFCFTVIILEI